MKKIKIGLLAATALLALHYYSIAATNGSYKYGSYNDSLQTKLAVPNGNIFTRDKLYGQPDLVWRGGMWEFHIGTDGMPTGFTKVFERRSADNKTIDYSTAALSPYGGIYYRDKDNNPSPLSLWYESWDNNYTPQIWKQLVSGTTTAIQHKILWPWVKYRDGAEGNQLTGEIYFSSDTISKFGGSMKAGWGSEFAALAVWDPRTGHTAWNNRLIPTGENLKDWIIATDMAIDAEGHMYVLARKGKKTKLVKIEIPRTPASENDCTGLMPEGCYGKAITKDWYYSVVQDFGDVLDSNIFGMAFFNGLLYAAYDYQTRVYVLNPLTGSSKYFKAPERMFDMASSQVAPIIRGTVYEDTEGNGIETDFIPLGGIIVEIWKDSKQVGRATTEADGSYHFIVDSILDQNYNIIINFPKIGEKKAIQTWASASENTKNSTIAYCIDDGILVKNFKSGKCSGNMSGNGSTIAEANIRSDVLMTTDRFVAIANFALSPYDLVKPKHIQRISNIRLY